MTNIYCQSHPDRTQQIFCIWFLFQQLIFVWVFVNLYYWFKVKKKTQSFIKFCQNLWNELIFPKPREISESFAFLFLNLIQNHKIFFRILIIYGAETTRFIFLWLWKWHRGTSRFFNPSIFLVELISFSCKIFFEL